jgi:hypothetical protein
MNWKFWINKRTKMEKIKFYRDGLEELIDAPPKVSTNRDGNVIESYTVNGKKRYFVELYGTPYCAHGETIAEATAAALWKDPAKRPSAEKLKAKINKDPKYKLNVHEFRILTGACLDGCRVALEREGLSMSVKMTPKEVEKRFGEWGNRLIKVLESSS